MRLLLTIIALISFQAAFCQITLERNNGRITTTEQTSEVDSVYLKKFINNLKLTSTVYSSQVASINSIDQQISNSLFDPIRSLCGAYNDDVTKSIQPDYLEGSSWEIFVYKDYDQEVFRTIEVTRDRTTNLLKISESETLYYLQDIIIIYDDSIDDKNIFYRYQDNNFRTTTGQFLRKLNPRR